ncbi:hypothetical protein MNBD_IGNAVI01-553 [hydrothermal vent metagenome]|uniref:Uncharacterized protein n=1 Tax=hydrothermal vent metagenome TaxID=652676 RepID=A0A3B1CD27_9ZZZZ
MNNYKIFETNEFQKKVIKIIKQEKSFLKKKLFHYIYPQLRKEPHYGNNIKNWSIISLKLGDIESGNKEYFMLWKKVRKLCTLYQSN